MVSEKTLWNVTRDESSTLVCRNVLPAGNPGSGPICAAQGLNGASFAGTKIFFRRTYFGKPSRS